VRADNFASPEQKAADLSALEEFSIDIETGGNILELSDARWQAVKQESIVVLEQVMRATIREDRLDEVRRSVPALVSLSLSEDQLDLVATLVTGFIAPNSFYSEEITEEARIKASESINPVTRSFILGETIIPGSVVLLLSREP
jgi:membrane-associated HD superfamily phosphohydrolase